jgi:hypothetical protein
MQRDFVAHERWMIRSFALTFAAVTLRHLAACRHHLRTRLASVPSARLPIARSPGSPGYRT